MKPKRLATFSGRWFIQWSQSRRCLVYIPCNLSKRVARVPTCFCPETSSRIRRSLCTCTIDLTTAHHFEYRGIIKLLHNRIENSLVYLIIVCKSENCETPKISYYCACAIELTRVIVNLTQRFASNTTIPSQTAHKEFGNQSLKHSSTGKPRALRMKSLRYMEGM